MLYKLNLHQLDVKGIGESPGQIIITVNVITHPDLQTLTTSDFVKYPHCVVCNIHTVVHSHEVIFIGFVHVCVLHRLLYIVYPIGLSEMILNMVC